MNHRFKRIVSGAAAFAVAAGGFSLLGTGAASAAGILVGPATSVVPGGTTPLNSGGSSTAFSLSLGSGAACGGDSTTGGYRVQSYMVPASVDPSTLTFGATGPTAVTGQFRGPLYMTTGSAYVNQTTQNAVAPSTTGQINQPLPGFNYAVYAPGNIPPGAYNIGIACTVGAAGPSQMQQYWNIVETFTTNTADSPAQINWAVGAVPNAPVLNTVTSGNGTLTANYVSSTSSPATTSWLATATPTAGGAAITATSTSATQTVITGLTNGTSYNVTVHATNSTGNSPESNMIAGTPAIPPHPAPTNLSATPVTGGVNLSWTAPSDAATTAPTGYTIGISPAPPAGSTTTVSGTTASVTGLTAGTTYTFTVTATYAAPPAGTTSAPVSATPLAAQVIVQPVTVTRPTGALVFTQVCGVNGAIPADTSGTPGFPNGSLPAVPASTAAGTAPTLSSTNAADPKFNQYPYPVNPDGTPAPNYPTNCGINLGNAQFVASGPGAGQFFAASGVLNQVSIVDTRDTDVGWTASGTMSTFSAASGTKTFSGSQLGWSPVRTSQTAPYTDSAGNTYSQNTAPGAVVNPNTPNATGLSSGRALGLGSALAGTAPNTSGGLGTAVFDARLKLLIPVTAKSGTYTGTLTISSV